MDNKNKIVKRYNGCEVTITFAGKNDKALDEAKRLIIESYIDCNTNTVDKPGFLRVCVKLNAAVKTFWDALCNSKCNMKVHFAGDTSD